MTISEKTTSARNDYIGNGVVTNFSFTFDVLNEANSLTGKNYSLKVLLTTSGTEAEQVEDTDYTVTYDSATRLGSVTFTTVPAKSVLITLLSDVSKTQSTDYINIGTDKFPADSHEKTVDKLTLITRELQEVIDRAILLSESSTISGVTLPVSAANANKAIVVNSAGTDLDAQSLIDLSLYPVTNFAETLLDDTTSTEARTTLDAEQKINSLVAITSLEDADQFIVTDNSDSDNSKKITLANMQGTTALRGVSYLPKRITVSNGTDTDHDIDFTAGVFNFDDGSGQAVASALTKQIDATWAAGTNQGGLFTGTVAIDTWYYCFAIWNPTTETYDSGFDPSYSSPTLPSGYTKKEYRGAILTDGSSNIRAFRYTDKYCIYDQKITDISTQSISTTKSAINCSTPDQLEVMLLGSAFGLQQFLTTVHVEFYRTGATSNMSAFTGGSSTSTVVTSGSDIKVDAINGSFDIRATSTQTITMYTFGFYDYNLRTN